MSHSDISFPLPGLCLKIFKLLDDDPCIIAIDNCGTLDKILALAIYGSRGHYDGHVESRYYKVMHRDDIFYTTSFTFLLAGDCILMLTSTLGTTWKRYQRPSRGGLPLDPVQDHARRSEEEQGVHFIGDPGFSSQLVFT
ncbi:uncharacterized protein EDB91DRAFT_1080332 [Suillus paluster]|uniref:uncharacterized protein n=1 Tax=Suillus paluster TaxID=48578 RepID=UPI001B883C47|nr:uncharacterized protein EDB91DRAFT_1080332 [Suillus paluster]KAG1745412.1 hypothetical protein EDB91DRAFT_1080332 [Suillus paluster]